MRSKKISKSTLYEKDFYLCLVEHIHKNKQIPKQDSYFFSKYPEIKNSKNFKQRMQYHINKLKKQGVIKRIGYGVWETNLDRFDQLRFQKKVKTTLKATKRSKKNPYKKDIRGHGFIISFRLPKIPNWYRRKEYLEKKNINYKEVGLNNCGQRIEIRGHKIHLYKSAIVIYSPKESSYFSEKAKTAKEYALHDLIQILHSTENLLGMSARFIDGYHFKVSRQHYAHVNNELANQYTREGKKLICTHKGKEWLIIDESFTSELETTHSETADKDQDNIIQPFFNSLKKHYESTGEAITIDNLMKLFVGMAKAQQETNRGTELIREDIKQIKELIK